MLGMVTPDRLAELLKQANPTELSRASGVTTKTIYRLREKANSPTLGTVERLLAGLKKLKQRRRKAA